jgi:hypothetical protein
MVANEDLINKLQQLGIHHVAVFDDEVENLDKPWFIDDEAWEGIVLFVEERLQEELGIDEADRARTARREERLELFSKIEQLTLPEELIEYEPDTSTKRLRQWIKTLEQWNLTVDSFSDWADFEQKARDKSVNSRELLRQYQLILLDYEFGPNRPLEQSDLIAFEVGGMLESLIDKSCNPPVLIKFSRERVEKTEAEKHSFAKKVKFPRGCYEFLEKDLITPSLDFENRFLLLIRDIEIGFRLYQLSTKVATTISRTVASEVLHVLNHLDPESIRFLSSQRLQPEGVTETDYLIDLLHNLFYSSLSCSNDVVGATKELSDHIRSEREPGAAFENIGLYYVQNRLLFNYKVNTFQRPVDLGDIFLFGDGDDVGIILTQSCDMSVRGVSMSNGTNQQLQGKPETERILLLAGRVVPSSDTGGTITRYFAKSQEDDQYLMLKWDFKNPIVFPRSILDLVSLNDEGRAVIPGKLQNIISKWWTPAYTEYISKLCKNFQDNLPDIKASGRSEITIPISNNGIQSLGGLNSFGTSVTLSVEKQDNDILLPIQRVARLQLVETLRLQQQYYASAGRIGVMTELRQNTQEMKIRVFDSKNQEYRITLPATRIIGKFSDGRKDWKKLMVHPSFIKNLQGFDPAFNPLCQAVSEFTKSFDLYEIYNSNNCANCYKLENDKSDTTGLSLILKPQPQRNNNRSSKDSSNT